MEKARDGKKSSDTLKTDSISRTPSPIGQNASYHSFGGVGSPSNSEDEPDNKLVLPPLAEIHAKDGADNKLVSNPQGVDLANPKTPIALQIAFERTNIKKALQDEHVDQMVFFPLYGICISVLAFISFGGNAKDVTNQLLQDAGLSEEVAGDLSWLAAPGALLTMLFSANTARILVFESKSRLQAAYQVQGGVGLANASAEMLAEGILPAMVALFSLMSAANYSYEYFSKKDWAPFSLLITCCLTAAISALLTNGRWFSKNFIYPYLYKPLHDWRYFDPALQEPRLFVEELLKEYQSELLKTSTITAQVNPLVDDLEGAQPLQDSLLAHFATMREASSVEDQIAAIYQKVVAAYDHDDERLATALAEKIRLSQDRACFHYQDLSVLASIVPASVYALVSYVSGEKSGALAALIGIDFVSPKLFAVASYVTNAVIYTVGLQRVYAMGFNASEWLKLLPVSPLILTNTLIPLALAFLFQFNVAELGLPDDDNFYAHWLQFILAPVFGFGLAVLSAKDAQEQYHNATVIANNRKDLLKIDADPSIISNENRLAIRLSLKDGAAQLQEQFSVLPDHAVTHVTKAPSVGLNNALSTFKSELASHPRQGFCQKVQATLAQLRRCLPGNYQLIPGDAI